MGTFEEKSRRSFGARAAFYTTSPAHADQAGLARVVSLARPRPDARVLDVATGVGHTALALAPHVREVVATDITPEMLAEARRLSAERGIANVSFQLANALALPFGDGSFDIVTCRRAAHHFSDVGGALGEMHRVLRDGGRLVLDDRCVPEDDFLDATMNRLDVLHDPSHLREYRLSEWSTMLARAGFVVESMEGYVRHRPLSSLTDGVDPEGVLEIERIVASLDEQQRVAMNVVEENGETLTNHWYVLIAAVK